MIAAGTLEVWVADTEKVVAKIEAPGVEGYIMGRSDVSSTYRPDIDLADYSARDKGVSRRHAALVRFRGVVHVIDLNSVNGTFLNGERLLPDVPYPLNSGGQLSLASLSLLIKQSNL